MEAERLVGRGDEGRPLAGLNLETPESHLVVSRVVVCEAVCDDGVMLLMAQQLEKPQNCPTAGTLFTVSNVARTWKLPKSKCQKKATPGSQPVDKIISPFAFCAKVASHRDTALSQNRQKISTNPELGISRDGIPADLLRETIPLYVAGASIIPPAPRVGHRRSIGNARYDVRSGESKVHGSRARRFGGRSRVRRVLAAFARSSCCCSSGHA